MESHRWNPSLGLAPNDQGRTVADQLDDNGQIMVVSEPGEWHEGLDDLPAGWKCPSGYEITGSGVWRIPPSDGDDDAQRPAVRIATRDTPMRKAPHPKCGAFLTRRIKPG